MRTFLTPPGPCTLHDVTASPVQLPSGTVFAGDFRIDGQLRSGGMGAVYIATQLSTHTRRAIKLMLPSYAASDSARRRFEQEARVGAQIPSEHVVQVIAAGFDEATQSPWLAMELLEGEELADRVRRSGPLPFDEARLLFSQLGHAMGAAHRARIVHRDLKPENIFLAQPRTSGLAPFTVKVLDFGIAKVASEAISQNTGTMGTPIWMAPEQTGPGHEIAPATDVWALGLIAYYTLTGRSFWRSASDAHASLQMLLREILIDPIPPLRDRAAEQGVVELLPAGFDAWFERCLRRETGERFADADEAMGTLGRLLRGEGGAAGARMVADILSERPAGIPGKRASTMAWVAGGVGLAAALAVGGALLLAKGPPKDPGPGDPRAAIAAGATLWQDLVLPQSSNADEPCDVAGFAVVVTPTKLYAGDPPKLLFPLGDDRNAGAPAQYKRLGVTDFFLTPLGAAIDRASARRVFLVVDTATPYRLLSEVLFTAGQQGISRWDFAVVRDGHPRSFAVYPPRASAEEIGGVKVLVLRDTFEVYLKAPGRKGAAEPWKPLAPGCERASAIVAPLRDGTQLDECLATVRRVAGKIVPQVTAGPEIPFGRVLLAVDRVRAGFGDVEMAVAEKVDDEKK